VKVLKERKPEALANLITDGEEKQSTAVLAKLSHRGGFCHGCRKEKVCFTLSFFGIEQTNGVPLLKRFNGALNVGLHVCRFGLTFMKSRIPSLLKTTEASKLADSQQKGIIM